MYLDSPLHQYRYNGIFLLYPFEELQQNAAGIGFSNFLKEENVRKVPLVAKYENEILFSFGYQMASLFSNEKFPISKLSLGCIRLNHFGSFENLTSMGFIDLLQAYKNNPDSLNFKDKLILITITAAGVTNLKSTPYDNAFPSSLVHLTVAENLIHDNYLIDTPIYLNTII